MGTFTTIGEAAQGVWLPGENRLIPLDEFQARQRERLAHHAPPRPVPPPRPDRAELETALIMARHRRVGTAAKAAKADAALTKAIQVAEDARRLLARIEQEDAERNGNLADRLREWIAAGSEGDHPRAREKPTAETRRHQAVETDLAAASAAVGALEQEFAQAKKADDDAIADVRDAARAILSEEATILAERIEALESEAAQLWNGLWGYAFVQLPGGNPLRLHPSASAAITTPPRYVHRTNIPQSRKTAEGQQAIEAARAQFDRLVAGEPEPAPQGAPHAPNAH